MCVQAMGMPERVGYDYSKSPCDPRYAPPEQVIFREQYLNEGTIFTCPCMAMFREQSILYWCVEVCKR